MQRSATIQRTTRETAVVVELHLDGAGNVAVQTGLGFLDHMLEAFAFHGLFDLRIEAKGDLEVDPHHTMEDVGLVLGDVLREAAGDRAGLRRFGAAFVPMDEALVRCVLDLSGRPFLDYSLPVEALDVGGIPILLFREFFRAFAVRGGVTLHMTRLSGDEPHHVFEAAFKALGRALDEATTIDPRRAHAPSTKGSFD